MAKTHKNVHVGGQQLPLLTPSSSWTAPRELPDLRRHKRIAIDTENRDSGLAHGLGPAWHLPRGTGGHVCGVGVAWNGGSLYAPINHPETENLFPREQVAAWISDHVKAGVRFAFHNAPYDIGWLRRDLGIEPMPGDQIDDTSAMAVMVDENRYSYSLNDLCKWQGLQGKDDAMLREAGAAYGFVGDGPNGLMSNLWRLPARYVGPYGEADPVQTLMLADKLDKIIDRENTRRAYRLECDLIPMTHEMRWRGVRVNVDYAEQKAEQLDRQIAQHLEDMSHKLGVTVTIDRFRDNKFMCRVCDEFGIEYPRTAKTGVGSFNKNWMRKHEHWFPRLASRIEQLEMVANKFLRGFVLAFAANGRLHASINQFRTDDGGTRSHRFSYAGPPLQQMPSRDEEFVEMVRGAFEPEPGERWLAADYSQQEYRLIVHFAEVFKCRRASEAADAYRNDPRTDFHTLVAEMTGLDRKPAKDTNFAKAFGAGVPKFASMIGKSLEEAEAIYRQYDKMLPFVSQLAEKCTAAANRRGYIMLLDGARSHFDHWEPVDKKYQYDEWGKYIGPRYAEEADQVKRWDGIRLRRAWTHKAMNRKIQGSAARMTKMAMLECWKEKMVPLLQMHDELDFSIGRERDGERVVEIMRDVVKLTVPVVVDAEYGTNWGDAKHAWNFLEKRDGALGSGKGLTPRATGADRSARKSAGAGRAGKPARRPKISG